LVNGRSSEESSSSSGSLRNYQQRNGSRVNHRTKPADTQETETEEMKRAAAKKLIERYFYQLIDGCGNPKCNNKYCASSGEVGQLTPNAAAARAIQLFSQEAKLCELHPSKMARTSGNSSTSLSDESSQNLANLELDDR
jgi:ubiquitin-protein ligase E3 A